jgi:hypothetical protein
MEFEGPQRIDVRFQRDRRIAQNSRRTHLRLWRTDGVGTDADVDAFVQTFSSVASGITRVIPAHFSLKTRFRTRDVSTSTANLLVGAVFIFRINDPADARYWNFLLPGVPDTLFDASGLIVSNAATQALAQHVITHHTSPSGEYFVSFEGGYRAFARFENQ